MNSLKAPSLSSLLSGTDRGSNDSLLESLNLDLDEIDDLSIPPGDELPSLDAIMSEMDSDIDSINSGLLTDKTNQTPTPSFDGKQEKGSILRHIIYHGITTQIGSAADRTEAGFASAIAVSRMVAVGTSHGFILAFDSTQTLRWCCLEGQKQRQGAVSCLSLLSNSDDSRLLAGFSRGTILMINSLTGDIIRTLTDAVSPNSGVLNIKWTSRPNLALALDSGGSVWSLSFTRRLGVRGCDSRCLFSGARGEVCTLEPLIVTEENHPLRHNYSLVALATLSKFFILLVKPRLKVVKYHMLSGPPDSLPLLSWQMVLIQSVDASRSVDPVLAAGRGNSLFFHQLSLVNGKVTVTFLRHINVAYNLLALHWLGPKNIACIERDTETVHLIDVRSSVQLESIDVSTVGIVYSSAQFKGIVTGSNVSPALALAGTWACYSTVVANDLNDTLYILGKRSLHGVNVRNWSERLSYLTTRQNWTEAFAMAVDGYKNTLDKPRKQALTKERLLKLFYDYLDATSKNPECCLESVIAFLIEIQQSDLLWQEIWERLYSQEYFLKLITNHILANDLTMISPAIAQVLLEYWLPISILNVERIILNLNWQCLDLHQALTISKNKKLYRCSMHLSTKALNDYTAALVDLTPLINENEDRSLGNTLLVYISSCLAGRGYPHGEIPEDSASNVKHDIMRTLTASHSMLNADDNELPYPFLRALLTFDTRETLNVLELAFTEKEFSTELGMSQRQRIVDILLEIISEDQEEQFGSLCNFMSRQIATKSLPDSSTFITKIMNFISSDANYVIANSRQHAEKEQAFMNLLEENVLTSRFTFAELLEIAYRTKCYAVAKFILEKLKNYDRIVECYIMSNNSFDLFRYIFQYKNSDERRIYQQIFKHFQSLLEIDCESITKIIIESYPICVPKFLQTIADIPKLHYNFMESLIDNNFPLETTDYNSFLALQCNYNPQGVLDFLQNSNHTYDIHHALNVVQEKNLTAATIFLLEKNGDYTRAFSIAMDLLLDAPESVAESYALKVGYLCMRASNVLSPADRESYWFRLIEVVLSRSYLNTIVKQILHLASTSVDLSKLVQLIMRDNDVDQSKKFGDIKHIILGMLSNFQYESLLLKTSQDILRNDLHKALLKDKQKAELGIHCTSLMCFLCEGKLSKSIATSIDSENTQSDQIMVFSICGHAFHTSCHQKLQERVRDSENTMNCPRCGVEIGETIHLEKVMVKEDEPTPSLLQELQLKTPSLLSSQ